MDVNAPAPDNFDQKDEFLNLTEQTILDNVVYEKKKKISHIIILVIVFVIAIAVPLLVLWFLLRFLSNFSGSKPDYDINITKTNWNKLIEGLPSHFDFDIINEDDSNGVMTISYNGAIFGYKCFKESAAAGLGSTYRCNLVVDNKDTGRNSFTGLLWLIHKEELYKLAEDVPEVTVTENGGFYIGENDPKIFFDLVMTIEDYRVYYSYIYEQYRADPSSNCDTEKDICSMRNGDYRFDGTIKVKGKKVMRTGSYGTLPWSEVAEYNVHILVWALSSGVAPVSSE